MNDDQPNDDRREAPDNSDIPDFIRQDESSDDGFEHETFAAPEPQNIPLALGVGAVVAALGGGLWAMVVIMFKVELGVLAWGIGLAVGAAIMAVAKSGDMRLGVGGATIALGGLLLGKVLIAQFGLAHTGAEKVVEDPAMLSDAVYYDMVQNEEVDPEVVSYYKTATDESRPGPELNQKLMTTEAKVTSRVEHMNAEEKQAVAQGYVDYAVGEMPFTDRMGFSGWDLLWLGLAVYTAFRICAGGGQAGGRRDEFA
jgi:hypothetical protein